MLSEAAVKDWQKRIEAGIKVKKSQWETPYGLSENKNYWKGNQLEEPEDEDGSYKATINKVHPKTKATLPSLFYGTPYLRVKPAPAKSKTPGQRPGMSIDDKAQMLQDYGNTLLLDDKTNIVEAVKMCVKEAQWAMGAVLCLHEADILDNPNIDKGPVKESSKTETGPDTKRLGDVLGLAENAPIVKSDRFYAKRIPSRQIIVSANHSGDVNQIPWVGYWDLYYVEDVKNVKKYRNTKDLKGTVQDIEDDKDASEREKEEGADKIKLFHVWDQRTKTYYVFAENHPFSLFEQKYKRLPLKFLRLDVDPDMFYPLPPIYLQRGLQDEVNESVEWLRLNRKGTVPRYVYDPMGVDPTEMKKLESGEAGTYIKRNEGPNFVEPIRPIQQPNYSQVAQATLAIASQGFNEVSSQAGEQRGLPTADTATQAKIMEVRSQSTESYDRDIVSKFCASIVEELVRMSIDRMSVPVFIRKNVDQSAMGVQLASQAIAQMWTEITHSNLVDADDGMDWSFTIESSSMSPVAREQEKVEFMQGLSLIGNPMMAHVLSRSPELLRRALTLHNVSSARDQELIGQALQIVVAEQQAMAMAGGPAQPGVASQPGGPPGMGSPGTIGPQHAPVAPGPRGNVPPRGPQHGAMAMVAAMFTSILAALHG